MDTPGHLPSVPTRSTPSVVARSRRLRAVVAGVGALLLGVAGLVGAPPAQAALEFPFAPDLATKGDNSWLGYATYADGWFRLTPAATSRSGAWISGDTFRSDLGLDISFTYGMHSGSGGDGFSFFLADGASSPGRGASGRALGYACAADKYSGGWCKSADGVPGGYAGIGFDQFGDFSGAINGSGGPGGGKNTPNSIVVRGAGDGRTGYRYITGTQTGVWTGDRAKPKRVRMLFMPDGAGSAHLTVFTDDGPGTPLKPRLERVPLTGEGQPRLPDRLRLGFAAATGANTNVHEFKDLRVNVPANITISQSGPARSVPGTSVEYITRVRNDVVNAVDNAVLHDVLPDVIDSPTWTCEGLRGARCDRSSGEGAVLKDTFDLPRNSEVVFRVRGTIKPDARGTLTNTARAQLPSDRSPVTDTPLESTVVTALTPSGEVDTTKSIIYDRGGAGVAPGEELTYRIAVANRGPSTLTDVGAEDALPSGLVFVSSKDSCALRPNGVVVCSSKGSLAVGKTKTFDFRAKTLSSFRGSAEELSNKATGTALDGHSVSSEPVIPHLYPPRVTLSTTKKVVLRSGTAAVTPGTEFGYRVDVTNQGPSDATGLKVSDELPAGLTFVSSPDGCFASNQRVSCITASPLAAGAQRSFAFTVRLDPLYRGTGSDLPNTATATSPEGGTHTSAPVTPPVGAPDARLLTQKDVVLDEGVAAITPGTEYSYRVTARNEGPSSLAAVGVVDTLPAGITFVSSASGCSAQEQDITCRSKRTLSPGESMSFEFRVLLDAAYRGNGSDLPNIATATSRELVGGTGSPSAPVTPPIGPPVAGLSTQKHVVLDEGTTSVIPGGEFGYRIVVTNSGPSSASRPGAIDDLPQGLVFASSDDGCSANGQRVTCLSDEALGVGGSRAFTFRVTLDPFYRGDGSDLPNVATAISPDFPGGQGTPSPSVTPPVGSPVVALSTSKEVVLDDGTTEVVPGGEFGYRIVAHNHGPSSASAIGAVDRLPEGLRFVSSPDDCTAEGRTVTCRTDLSVGKDGEHVFTLRVMLDPSYRGDGSDMPNIATATAPEAPGGFGTPSAAVTPPVGQPRARMTTTHAIELDGSAADVAPGETFRFRSIAMNIGVSSATDVALATELPDGLIFVSAEDCAVTGRLVSCGSGRELQPGESAEYVYRVALDPDYRGVGDDLASIATATSPDDPEGGAPSDPVEPAVRGPETNVVVDKQAPSEFPVAGSVGVWTLSAINKGPSSTGIVTLIDELPSELEYVSGGQGSCAADGGSVRCRVERIAVGERIVFHLNLRVKPGTPAGTIIKNTVVQASDEFDLDPVTSSKEASTKPVLSAPLPPGSPLATTGSDGAMANLLGLCALIALGAGAVLTARTHRAAKRR